MWEVVLDALVDINGPSLNNNLCDLNFYWRGDIDLELCNGDYMGQNAQSVVNYMKRLLY